MVDTKIDNAELQKEYEEKKKKKKNRFFSKGRVSHGLEFLDELISKLLKWNREDISELKYAGETLVNNGARIILHQAANEHQELNTDQYNKEKKSQEKQI